MEFELNKDNFFGHAYQPIYSLSNFTVWGYEAFLRPAGYDGDIESIFLRAKEENILYLLDTRSIESTIEEFYGKATNHQKLFLNVFPSTLSNPYFPLYLYDLLNKFDRVARQIVLEINESEKIEDITLLEKNVTNLRKHGVSFAIDDFGKGMDFIKKIIELEPEYVKLDRYFSIDLAKSKKKQNMIKQILKYFEDKTKIILEGIEEPEDLAMAKLLGIHLGQGYLLSEPRSIDNIHNLVRSYGSK